LICCSVVVFLEGSGIDCRGAQSRSLVTDHIFRAVLSISESRKWVLGVVEGVSTKAPFAAAFGDERL
jgi:hypothetical protein